MATVGSTVLVIDDEAPIRRLVQRMLEPALCRVLEAEDAEAGLRLIEEGHPSVDAVLTDWIMPGLHGLDVVEVLHRHRPDLPVAVISAYTSTIHPIERDGDGLRILQKPFTAGDLQGTVAEMIGRAVALRDQARRTRERAVRAREHSAGLQGAARSIDLVHAAWELHRTRDQQDGFSYAPWLFGFADRVWQPHLIIGLIEIGSALMTRRLPADGRHVHSAAGRRTSGALRG